MCFKKPSHLNQMEEILHNITDMFEMKVEYFVLTTKEPRFIPLNKVRTSYFD